MKGTATILGGLTVLLYPGWVWYERPWHADLTLYIFLILLELMTPIDLLDVTNCATLHRSPCPISPPISRYFLHRQGIFRSNVYSLFDELQDFHEIRPQVLQLRDIEWEEDASLFTVPFTILVLRMKALCSGGAWIEGFISTIQYFKEDGLLSANYPMDDRGLVSR